MQDRNVAVDVVRGLVMVLMALDHGRDYLVSGRVDPTDVAHTSASLFFTRWSTHFCAPAFVLLAGTSVFLYALRHRSTTAAVARRIVWRGLVLIGLDLLVLPVLWWFNFDYSLLVLGVLWAIGWSMIVLAGCIFLSSRWIVLIALVMILFHNATDHISFENGSFVAAVWSVLHVHAGFRVAGIQVVTAYPLIPWIGVMLLGYALGELLSDTSRRQKRLIWLGLSSIGGFLVLRGLNFYGDPLPWTWFEEPFRTLLSFLNCTKYPPSLAFLLMTLGPILLILGLLGEKTQRWHAPFITLGRTPLFFYMIHIAVFHAVGVGLSLVRYGRAEWWFHNPPFTEMPEDYGWGLPMLYVSWFIVTLGLIPLCHFYRRARTK